MCRSAPGFFPLEKKLISIQRELDSRTYPERIKALGTRSLPAFRFKVQERLDTSLDGKFSLGTSLNKHGAHIMFVRKFHGLFDVYEI